MNNKLFLAIILVVASLILITVLIQPNLMPLSIIEEEKIYCSTWYGVGWYQKDGVMAFGDYQTKQPHNDYRIGVKVTNNSTQTLFRVHVDLSYKTSNGSWSTISEPNIGMIDISEKKHIVVSLIDPFLSKWEIEKLDTNSRLMTTVSIPTMSCDDVRVAAYGYKTP